MRSGVVKVTTEKKKEKTAATTLWGVEDLALGGWRGQILENCVLSRSLRNLICSVRSQVQYLSRLMLPRPRWSLGWSG